MVAPFDPVERRRFAGPARPPVVVDQAAHGERPAPGGFPTAARARRFHTLSIAAATSNRADGRRRALARVASSSGYARPGRLANGARPVRPDLPRSPPLSWPARQT